MESEKISMIKKIGSPRVGKRIIFETNSQASIDYSDLD